ncbi:hypothetical protein BKA65DRAFT_592402 [Rhexocercosporidium sp. MPI-PUGE-AT-0058]|nr:hypothetical protein BKA65DRAFT_592402 [Rhexocercosporidium sp. MPI-PUGE-AT-0058]
MAKKTSAKRKSESALPAGKSKRRKTSAQREAASNSVGEESSEHLFVDQEGAAPKHIKKSSLKSRKSEPVKRAARADEYDQDEGRSQGQQFLAGVEFVSKNKKWEAKVTSNFMERFEGRINKDEEFLKNHLHDVNLVASKQVSDFTEIFKNAYAASRPLPPTATGESQANGLSKDISFAILFDRSQRLIEDAKLVIEKFETARQKTAKVETTRFMDNHWSEESERTADILAIGHKVGLERYEAMLMGSSEPDIEEEDSVYADLFYQEAGGAKFIPWGGIAKKGEKIMRKLVKSIVMEVA